MQGPQYLGVIALRLPLFLINMKRNFLPTFNHVRKFVLAGSRFRVNQNGCCVHKPDYKSNFSSKF